MKCFYCSNSKIDRKRRGIPRCDECGCHYLFNNKNTNQVREIIFFVNIDEKDSYRVDNSFEDNTTRIYKISMDGKYIKMKIIFSTELFDITPHNADHFFKKKLKLYQLFS